VQIDAVARLEVARHGLGSEPGEAHLSLGVVGIDEVHVERDLAVDADGLNLLDERRARPLEHYFRRPFTKTSIESGLGLTNASRVRPSSV
jgi:hypothetical protein